MAAMRVPRLVGVRSLHLENQPERNNMEIKDRVVVVTGAAGGIGGALARVFAEAGAKRVVCADLDQAGAEATAEAVGGIARKVNVAQEKDIQALIEETERNVGPIDLFCSNAGIFTSGGPEKSDEQWERIWKINLMAHVYAARHLVPRMAQRGGGYLLNTASAAGLLSQVGSALYSVTKHAAVGLAEWLALTYGDQGIKVSVLCPQAVRTGMTKGHEDSVASVDGMMEPEPVARACLEAIRKETFLVLPHPQVLQYMRNKTADYDRWIGGMRKLDRQYNPRA
jgi:NAD(P)-dependent dehydrogenase (short-subunit alcohol dehydrogenase family)